MGAVLIEFSEEKTKNIINELQPLIQKHWEQIALNQETIKLDPDWKQYRLLEDAGMLRVFTARENGVLVGYFAVGISKHLHYKSDTFASCDVIYVKPDSRAGNTGFKLIRHVEKQLEKSDVKVLHINTKLHAPFDKLLEKMGYNAIETIYAKKIGG